MWKQYGIKNCLVLYNQRIVIELPLDKSWHHVSEVSAWYLLWSIFSLRGKHQANYDQNHISFERRLECNCKSTCQCASQLIQKLDPHCPSHMHSRREAALKRMYFTTHLLMWTESQMRWKRPRQKSMEQQAFRNLYEPASLSYFLEHNQPVPLAQAQ